MQAEVQAIVNAWILHFNKNTYEGNWSGLSLRAPGGVQDSLSADDFYDQQFMDTPLMAQCPYVREVLASFPCELRTARLLKLAPGAVIKEHRDLGLNYERGEARLHIPVFTHPLVEFYLDGDRIEMEEGSCWYVNANMRHSAVNNSTIDRIHLVVDCKVNDWVKEQFARTDLPVKSENDAVDPYNPPGLRETIIAALKASGEPEKLAIAAQMEQSEK